MPDDMYHCCRWCKWYRGGYCVSRAFDDVELYPFWENGELMAAIKKIIPGKESESARDALVDSIADALEDFEGTLAGKTGIADPFMFYCKDWV